MNGFDARGYRLGYGGGFFDRTLAAAEPRPVAIGVSYEALRLETIFPQAHDVPMDFVVTESGVYAAGGDALEVRSAAEARARSAQLFTARAPNNTATAPPHATRRSFRVTLGTPRGRTARNDDVRSCVSVEVVQPVTRLDMARHDATAVQARPIRPSSKSASRMRVRRFDASSISSSSCLRRASSGSTSASQNPPMTHHPDGPVSRSCSHPSAA